MDSLEAVFQSIETEVRSASVGRPVCTRASFVLSEDHGKLTAVLARATAAAFGWLADEPLDLYASGSVRSGHVGILAQGAGGTSVLLSTTLVRGETPRADILLLGSRGTLHHEGAANGPHEDLAGSSFTAGDLSAGERRLLEAIESSLEERTLVRWTKGE